MWWVSNVERQAYLINLVGILKIDSYLILLSKMKVQYLKIRHHRGKSSAVRIYHLPYSEVCGGGGGAVGSEGNSTCWLPVVWTCRSLLRLTATLGDRYYPQLSDKETGIKNPLSTFKKARCESCKLFYLGQNEDYNPGENTSDSSEKLPQRGRGDRTV